MSKSITYDRSDFVAKITLVGDMLCEPLLLKAAQRGRGAYSFECVFEQMEAMFESSDYVIGNLETPLGHAQFVDSLFSFNAPSDFALSAKRAGVDMVLTANNHCLDRGFDGLTRTLRILDECKLEHTGTFADASLRAPASYFEVGGNKVAVVSYTYGTNFSGNRIRLHEPERDCVNLLRPQDDVYSAADLTAKKKSTINKLAQRLFSFEQRIRIKKALGKEYYRAYADDYLDKVSAGPYLAKMQADILEAKGNADVVLFCPHVGGQFNAEPGAFTEYVVEKALEAGCDAVVASHPHVVQKADSVQGVPVFFSIGNFCMSPNSVYLLHDNLPEYGIAVHLYINAGQIVKASFSVLKAIETKKKPLTVYPASKLYSSLETDEDRENLATDVKKIVNIVAGFDIEEPIIREEYAFRSE